MPDSSYHKEMDDNTFECPSCSARVYPEMTRCPQCGQNMYPEDEVTALPEDGSTTTGWGGSLGAVLIGWMIASCIAILVHFIVAGFVTPALLGDIGKIILFLAGPVGSLMGGYVAAGLARKQGILLGGLVGLLSLVASVLFTTHWVQVTLALLLSPWFLGAALLIVLAGLCGGWLARRFSQNAGWQEKWKVRGWEDLLYQDLLRKVRFNGSAADRLIEYERKQEPQASRLKLIQSAIERWERDNR